MDHDRAVFREMLADSGFQNIEAALIRPATRILTAVKQG